MTLGTNEHLDRGITEIYDRRTAVMETLDAHFIPFCLGWLVRSVERGANLAEAVVGLVTA
jgi:hypothetical protein